MLNPEKSDFGSGPARYETRLTIETQEKRSNFEIIGDGHGVHWPDVDEDLSVEEMLHAVPAPRPKK